MIDSAANVARDPEHQSVRPGGENSRPSSSPNDRRGRQRPGRGRGSAPVWSGQSVRCPADSMFCPGAPESDVALMCAPFLPREHPGIVGYPRQVVQHLRRRRRQRHHPRASLVSRRRSSPGSKSTSSQRRPRISLRRHRVSASDRIAAAPCLEASRSAEAESRGWSSSRRRQMTQGLGAMRPYLNIASRAVVNNVASIIALQTAAMGVGYGRTGVAAIRYTLKRAKVPSASVVFRSVSSTATSKQPKGRPNS